MAELVGVERGVCSDIDGFIGRALGVIQVRIMN